jgi:hypothetical protein
LLYKGQWHQYGHAHLISTGGANGVINLSGEWNQYGTVLLEATGETGKTAQLNDCSTLLFTVDGAKGVFLGVFSGPPGVWNQYGSAEIVVLQGNGTPTLDGWPRANGVALMSTPICRVGDSGYLCVCMEARGQT